MLALESQIPFVLGTILLMIVVLVTDRFKASLVFLLAATALIIAGSIALPDLVDGIRNPSILTIFALILITAGINDHFDLAKFFDKLFGSAGNPRSFIIRMGLSVSAVSSVMNNTPVVAMMMPYVYQWGKKHNISPSRLLLPLSYSAIVGGVITLIGTSTNLVLNGLLRENALPTLGFQDFLIPGVLVTLGVLFFMYLFAPALIPDNRDVLEDMEDNARKYLVETIIDINSPLAGKSVEDAGLRNLERVFLTEIIRDGKRIAPVRPIETIKAHDILLFAGDTTATLELIGKMEGLDLSKKSKFEISDNAKIVEAIVSQNSEMERRTAKEVGFREKFDAAIIGIHRQGEKIAGKIGSIPFKAGDLLLLTAGSRFYDRARRTNDLMVINTHEPKKELPQARVWIFLTSLLLAIILMVTGYVDLFAGLLLILLTQVLLKMINLEKIKQNISLDLLIILISSLAIGKALIDSGSADYLTTQVFNNSHTWSNMVLLISIFLSTFILTSLVTNVAAITIVFPIVYSLTTVVQIPAQAMYLTAAFGASCCFATPFAYQTNLMVMEVGNYRFKDFLRLGLPVSLVYAVIFLGYVGLRFNLI